MGMRLHALISAVAMTLTTLTGCALGRGCTLIGAESGVSFDLVDAVPASTTTFEIHACVDDVCVDEPYRRDWVFVRLPGVSSERGATARVTLRSNSVVVFEATTPVTLRKHQPNGPGCAPTVYQAQVKATAPATLVVE
jgi:hypothetical protein